jgi:methyl-accepting chemotaxis protein
MNNMKIGIRLTIAFFCIIAFTFILGVYSLSELRTLDANSSIIYEKATIPLGLLVRTTELEQEMRLQVREWKIGKTDEERAAAIKVLNEANVSLKKLVTEQKDRAILEEARVILDNLMVAADTYVAEAHTYIMTNKVRMICGMTEADLPQSLLDAGKNLRKAVAAAIDIKVNSAKAVSENNSQIFKKSIKITFIILILTGLVSIGLSINLTSYVTGALKIVVNAVSKMENGDMTARSELKFGDEFGMLSTSVNSLAFKLQNIIGNLSINSDSLASSSEELSVISSQLVNISEESLQQSMTVTSTTGQVLTNIIKMAKEAEKASVSTDNVAGEMEQVSTNVKEMTRITEEAFSGVGTMVDATKQMSMSMNFVVDSTKEMKTITDQIVGNANETHKMVGDAITSSRNAIETLNKLNTAIMEIGSTNNTKDIELRVEGIKASVNEVIAVIKNVSSIIGKVNEKAESISKQMNHQIRIGTEMVGNIEQADTGIKRIDEYMSQIAKSSKGAAINALRVNLSVERVSQSVNEVANNSKNIARSAELASKGTKLISYNTIDMNRAAHNNAQGAKQVNKNANELARIASYLKSVVDQFKI